MRNNIEKVIVAEMTRTSGDSVQKHDPIVSDDSRRVLEIVFYSALGGSIGVLGSAVNVVNIIIFVKQGFKDSVSISLCALAVSDLGFLLPMIWISICSNPLFEYSDISFDSVEISYITGGLPHSCFVRVTGCITAFITFERCVCIALPLKVKNIITPNRTLISVVAMFIIIFAGTLPVFSSIYFDTAFRAKRNKTLVGLIYTSNTKRFEEFSLSFNTIMQITSFIIVINCTVILVIKLLAVSEWRNKAMNVSDTSQSISARDNRVMKMVTLISGVFIISYFPSCANLIAMIVLPEYSATGQYVNIYLVSWAVINSVEGTSSSVNILIYYKMSRKFRAIFIELFSRQEHHLL